MLLRVAAALLLIRPWGAQAGPPSAAAETVRRLLALGADAVTLEAWPGAREARCHGPREVECEDEETACHTCVLVRGGVRARYEFHPDLAAGDCTLQRVRIDFGAPGPERNEVVALADLLPGWNREPEDVAAAGHGGWPVVWSSGDDRLQVGPVGPSSDDFTDQLLLERKAFRKSALARDRVGPHERWRSRIERRRSWLHEACRSAGSSGCGSGPEIEEKDLVLAAAIDRFRGTARADPAIVYLIDGLLRDGAGWDPETSRLRPGVAGGFAEERATPEGGFVTPRTQLITIALTRQDSLWGRRAFLEMFESGWVSIEEEEESVPGAVRHLGAIALAEAFLLAHPGSETSPAILLALARAYDSWWSQSLAGEEACAYDGYPDGEPARRKALDLYRRYRRERGRLLDAAERLLLDETVFRLERRIDTLERFLGPICRCC